MKRKDKFSDIIESIPPSGIREFFEMLIGADDIISLGVGEPDFTTPWKIREEAFYHLEKGHTTYTSNWGLLELRIAISNYLTERFATSYDPHKEILATIGVSEGLDISLRAILNPGDEVIVAEPTFVAHPALVELAGGVTVTLDTSKTNFIPKASAIEKLITPKTKAILLCYPNNPTGRTIPKSELQKIASLVQKHQLWILSDEVYAELAYETKHTSLASLPGMKPYTITLNGFSKAFAMTGWRIGFLCGPADFMERAVKVHQYNTMCAPIMSQYAALEALKNGLGEMKLMVKSYQQRRNLMVKRFDEMDIPIVKPEGAFYLFADIRKTGLSSKEFATRLVKEHRVAVVPGSAFGECGEGFVRCCYATELSQLKEALLRIEKFIKEVSC